MKTSLWGMLLLPLILVVLFLLTLQVPQDIQKGIDGQVAMQELDSIGQSLLEAKTIVSRFPINEDEVNAKSELNELDKAIAINLQNYRNTVIYSQILRENEANFSQLYNQWINTEKEFINRYYQQHRQQTEHNNDHYLSIALSENNALFLKLMQLRAESETFIHHDIEKGRQASQLLQWAGALLILYFFITIVVFQRNSSRDHAARENNLEVTLRSIGEAVIATDFLGNVTCMNPEAERLTGWNFKEAKGRPLAEVFKVINEHSNKPIADLVEQVMQQKGIVVLAEDFLLIDSNGNRYQIYESGAPIYDDSGMIIGVVLVFRDITQTHRLNARIDESTQRLQRVIDTSMDAVIVVDEHGVIEEWNPAAEKIFGWTREEIGSQPIHELIIPVELRAQHLQGIERLISNNQLSFHAKRIDSSALHKDGHIFPIEMAMTSIRTEKGWMFNAFIRDLTEHKKQEITIEKNNILLRETQRIAKLGYWELDLNNDALEWSDEIFQIYCLDPAISMPCYELFLNTVHPDDRENVDLAFTESVKNKTPYNIIHRIIANDEVKVVHQQCLTTYDDQDNPVRSLGLVQDITERINHLEELRLAATMFNTHAGILITETDGTIIRVNPAFEKMTGYSSQELIGQNPSFLQSGKQDKNFYANMWREIAENGMWQGELWNKHKSGTLYAEWLTLTAVKNESGEVTHYVGTTQDVTTRKQAESKIEYRAYHDDLTDLANRRLLHDRLHQNISTCKRDNTFGAVLLLDLDRFKDLNDSLGHSAGDEILRLVATRLKSLMREEDTIARMGGDEFVVILPSVDSDISTVGLKVQAIAEKIRLSLSQPYQLNEESCYLNVSIGISLFPDNADNIDDILKHADTALYRAKAQGRNTVCFYHPSMQIEVDARLVMCNGLRNAIKNNELLLHYQPQVNSNGEIIGAEALIRWQHPEQGMIPPNQFISVAEDTGLILDIGEWVLQEAARQVAEWHANDVCSQDMLRLAINVSARQFHQPDFVEQVLSIFRQAGVSTSCIELEVTESLLMSNIEEVVEKMHALRKHDIRISIDDFGTGYSCLSYLKQLPIDLLKIDQSFVRDITQDKDDAMVVETIIAMSRHLGLNVIAEGVETQQQMDFLITKGCNTFQGYFFSRPLNAEAFADYIGEQKKSYIVNQALHGSDTFDTT